MKKQELLQDAFGLIDDKWLTEARAPARVLAPRRRWQRIAVTAACLILVAAMIPVSLLLGGLLQKNDPTPTPPVQTEKLPNQDEQPMGTNKENESTPGAPKPTPTYEVFEVGDYDYVSGASHKLELSLIEQEQFVDSAKRGTKSFLLHNGETVEGTYYESMQSYWHNSTVDSYLALTEESLITLYWNSALNRLDFYSEAMFDNGYDSSISPKSREDCIEIAKDFLKNLTEDSDMYKVVGVEDMGSGSSKEHTSYYITFERVIGVFNTQDKIAFMVETDGDLTHYGYWGFGTLQGVEEPAEEVLAIVEGKMEEKLSSIYKECSEKYTVEYEWQNWKLVRMQNGKLAIIKSISVTLTEKELGTSSPINETVELLTYLEA